MARLVVKTSESETRNLSLSQGETVLHSLLKAGYEVPYGCQSGVCHSCVLKSPSKNIPHAAQKGLCAVERSQGYFLSCCCQPEGMMEVHLSEDIKRYPSKVISLDKIANDVWRLRLEKSIAYRPGQYINIRHVSGVTRSYSIASHPTLDNFIECHIRTHSEGRFSKLVLNEIKAGDMLEILGPYGNCVYESKDTNQTLFLAGLGTGLSPLYGVARDALFQSHKGRVVMLVATANASNLYFQTELASLKKQFSQLEVHYSVKENTKESKAILPISDVYQTAATLFPDLSGCRVYLCGNSSFVQKLRKDSFLRGASLNDIHVDEFIKAVV